MRIAIANDHGGFNVKWKIIAFLKEEGYTVDNFGSDKSIPCDYPDFGIPAARSVARSVNDRAILICSNGIGMSILSNKISGIVGALVYNDSAAVNTRKHHDSNVLCLGGKEFSDEKLLGFVKLWLNTEFEGGRHERRMNKIKQLELK